MTEDELRDKLWKQRNGITKGLSLLEGLTSIAGTTYGMTGINGSPIAEGQIQDMRKIGSNNYDSFGDLSNAYRSINSLQPDIDVDQIRGGSPSERIGSTLSNTLTGATTGATVGGPIGFIIGSGVGLGASIGGWIAGDRKADWKAESLGIQGRLANNSATRNLAAEGEHMAENDFRSRMNVSAKGGKINRQRTVKEFADKVLGNQKNNDVSHSGGLIIKKCDGGTMIRIKR